MFAHFNFWYVWVMMAPMITTALSRKNYRSAKSKELVQILNAVIGAGITTILLFAESHAGFLQLARYWTHDFSDSSQNSGLALAFMLTSGLVFGLALGYLFEISAKHHRNSVQHNAKKRLFPKIDTSNLLKAKAKPQKPAKQPQAASADRPIHIGHLSAQGLAQAMLEEWGQLEKPEAKYH